MYNAKTCKAPQIRCKNNLETKKAYAFINLRMPTL